MNTPISFEIAKLLKEKGFDLNHKYMFFTSDETEKYPEEELSLKPTIAEVVMWLYEKHEIWIEVSCHTVLDEKDDDIDVDVFYSIIRELKPVSVLLYSGDFVNSPTEAYEAAIIYTLENLI